MRRGPREPRASGLEQWEMSELPSLDVGWGTPSAKYRTLRDAGP
jgi:hypothetical protein